MTAPIIPVRRLPVEEEAYFRRTFEELSSQLDDTTAKALASVSKFLERSAAQEALNEYKYALSAPSKLAIEKFGVDVTDPRVEVEGLKLPLDLKVARTVRYFGEVFTSSLLTPLGFGGLELAETKGLAEPRGILEGITAYLAAPAAAASTQVLAAVGLAGALALAGVGGAAAGGAAAAGSAGSAPVLTNALGRLRLVKRLGLAAGLEEGSLAARLPASRLASAVTGVSFDAATGALGGVVVAEGQEAVEAARGPVEIDPITSALFFGGLGMGLGTLFRIPTVWNTGRAAFLLLTANEADLLQGLKLGSKVNGMELVLQKGRVKGKLLPEHPEFQEGKEIFRDVTIEDIAAEFRRQVEQAAAAKAKVEVPEAPEKIEVKTEAPEAKAAEAQEAQQEEVVAQVAQELEKLPQEVKQGIEEARRKIRLPTGEDDVEYINGLAARLTMDKNFRRVVLKLRDRSGEEGINRLLAMLQEQALDAASDVSVKATALAQIAAVQHVLGTAAAPDIELYSKALRVIEPLKEKLQDAASRDLINNLLVNSRGQYEERVLDLALKLLDEGAIDPSAAVQSFKKVVAKGTQVLSRGFKKGDRGYLGKNPVVLLDHPVLGRARARNLLDGSTIEVDVKDIAPLPYPKDIVILRGGKRGMVVSTTSTGKVKVVTAGRTKPLVVEPSEIEGMDLKPDKEVLRKLTSRFPEPETGDLIEIPGKPIVPTKYGEKVQVLRAGAEALEVQPLNRNGNPSGNPYILRRDDIGGFGEVEPFVPYIPPKGSRLLYIEVPESRTDAFEKRYLSGNPVDEFGGTAYVIPQEPKKGYVQYAIEVPSSKANQYNYSPSAKAILSFLKSFREGKPAKEFEISSHRDAMVEGVKAEDITRVFKVPEELLTKAVRKDANLSTLRGETLANYISKLLILDEEAKSIVTKAIKRAKARGEIAATSTKAAERTEAKRESHKAVVEALEAAVKAKAKSAEAEAAVETAAKAIDPDAEAKIKLSKKEGGDEALEALRRAIEDLRTLPETARKGDLAPEDIGEALVWPSKLDSRDRLVVRKFEKIVTSTDATGKINAVPKVVYSIDHYSGDKLIATDDFDTLEELLQSVNALRSFDISIRRLGGFTHVNLENRQQVARVVPRKDGKVDVFLGKNDGEGGLIEIAKGRKAMTPEEAEDFLYDKGFIPLLVKDPATRLGELPSLAEVLAMGVNELRSLESILGTVGSIVSDFKTSTGFVPRELKEYAKTVGEHFRKLSGEVPYTPKIREYIDYSPTVSDLVRARSDKAVPPAFADFFTAVEKASIVADEILKRTKLVGSYAKTLNQPIAAEPAVQGTAEANLGRLKDGSLVVIDSIDMDKAVALVRRVGKLLKTEEVSLDDLVPIEPDDFLDVIPELIVADPSLHKAFAERGVVIPLGLGAWERKLNLVGVKDARRFVAAVDAYLGKLKGGKLLTSAGATEDLVELHTRMLEIQSLPEGAREDLADKVLKVVEAGGNKETFRSLLIARRLADERIPTVALRRALSLADMGELDKEALESLKQLAEAARVPKSLISKAVPGSAAQGALMRAVMNRNGIDYLAAAVAEDLSEAGFLLLKAGQDFGEEIGKVKFKPVNRVRDLFAPWATGPAARLAARHPVSMSVVLRIRDAWIKKARKLRVPLRIKAVLHSMGKTAEDFEAAAKHIRNTPAEENAVDTAPENLKPVVALIQELMEEAKYSHIRSFLRLGLDRFVEVDSNDLGALMKLLPAEVVDQLAGKGVNGRLYLSMAAEELSNPDLERMLKGMKVSLPYFKGKPPEEIEQFIGLLKNKDIKSAAQLPDGLPQWMYEDFDFWRGWGMKNYFPNVHRGNHLILVIGPNGEEVPIARATNGLQARVMVRELFKKGIIDDWSRVKVVDTASRKQDYEFDEFLVEYIPRNRNIKAALEEMAKASSIDGEEIRALLLTSRPEKTRLLARTPADVHALPRTVDMRNLFDSEWDQFFFMWSRIANMEYNWDLLDAASLLADEAFDEAMSAAAGVQPLRELPNLRKWTIDRIRFASGARTSFEKYQDDLIAFFDYLGHLPEMKLRKYFKGEEELKLEDFRVPYAARGAASSLMRVMTQFKLGGSVGSAVANLSQYWVLGVPKFIAEGLLPANPVLASKEAFNSWLRGLAMVKRLSKSLDKLSEEERVWLEFLDETGANLQTSKVVAPAIGVFGDVTSGRPVKFGKDWGEYAQELLEYYNLFLFNGAEKANRFATALHVAEGLMKKHNLRSIVELRANDKLWRQAVAKTKQLDREINFLYDEIDLPHLVLAGGPIARLVYQFKPFLLNYLLYLKDMLVGVAKGNPKAAKQLAAFTGMTLFTGGLVGLTDNPLVSLVNNTLELFNVAPPWLDTLSAKRHEDRKASLSVTEQLWDQIPFRWQDLLYYGAPAALGLYMGSRIGVTGQDAIFALTGPSALGPTGQAYIDTITFLRRYFKLEDTDIGKIGIAAGLLSSPAFFRGAGAFAAAPFLALSGGLVSTTVAKDVFGVGQTTVFSAMENTPEGRRLLQNDFPVLVKSITNSASLILHGHYRDRDGRPIIVPGSEVLRESLAAMTNFTTIRKQEQASLIGHFKEEGDKVLANRRFYVTKLARAWERGDYKMYYETLAEAIENGIEIPSSSVDRELEKRKRDRLKSILRSITTQAREAGIEELQQ